MRIAGLTTEHSIDSNKLSPRFNAHVHIIDGFLHADNMEHFAKAALKKSSKIDDLKMHYVECNRIDINTKQMRSVEDMLKNIAAQLKSGDFLAIPGLAAVPVLNLIDRIKNVIGKYVNLTSQNLKLNKSLIVQFLKEIYTYKHYYASEISLLDRNSQDLAYTYGVIDEINKLVNKGVNVYIPAGHGADSTIKWLAKSKHKSDDLYSYIAKKKDSNGYIQEILKEANERNYYDFNLLSLCKGHIVNIKDLNGYDYIFSAKDGLANDGERGVYNFTPIRNSYGRLLGYSYHDESTVEYPFEEYKGNSNINNLCKYVGLPYSDFIASYEEDKNFRDYIKKGYPTTSLPDKLYELENVFDNQEIRNRGLNKLGHLINNKQNLIFDTNEKGQIIFQKTNCESSSKPSVVSMWGSCFSAINAMVRDIKTAPEDFSNTSYYITQGDYNVRIGNFSGAEYYYNKALNNLHPNKSTFEYESQAIKVYENLYKILKFTGKYPEAKGIANMIINLKCYEIKNKSVFDIFYMQTQSNLSKYYRDLAEYCEKECEYYPANVCRWAANELKKNSYYGDCIVQRRADQNQYIGDLYDEYH